ncbi:hypothetical protein pb186bvf_019293 [Paramecium bursaria]
MENQNPVEKAVNTATAETLQMPDQKLMKDVSDLINARSDFPKLAVQAIGKRLMMMRNFKVQALTLELLEYCAFTCEISFYNQIATNDFIQRLNTLLNPIMDKNMQTRLLQVIFVYKQLMLPHQDLFPTFVQFINKLQGKLPTHYESRYSALKKAPTYTSKVATIQTTDNAKTAKLKKDLETVKSNMNLTNEIIDNTDPNDDVTKNDILSDLMKTLRGVEDKLRNLIQNMSGNDEGMMSYCLELNDDLVKTFQRYESLKRHKKPEPFKIEQFKFDQQPQVIAQQPIQQQNPAFQQIIQQQIFAQPEIPKKQEVKSIDLLDLFEVEAPPQQIQQQPVKVVEKPKEQQDLLSMFDDQPPQQVPQLLQQQIPIQQTQVQQPPIQQQIPNIQNLYNIPSQQQAPSMIATSFPSVAHQQNNSYQYPQQYPQQMAPQYYQQPGFQQQQFPNQRQPGFYPTNQYPQSNIYQPSQVNPPTYNVNASQLNVNQQTDAFADLVSLAAQSKPKTAQNPADII